jgi:hypothetical protein
MLYFIPDTLLKVSLNTNKTGHHVILSSKEKCVSADLMHFDLFLVRFVTVRLTYIFIDYPDCEYIIILNASVVIDVKQP